MHPSKSGYSPIGLKSGIPVNFPERCLDNLREAHPSVPNNPLVAESVYLTRYIERVGSGTQAMIVLCREVGLPEPDFELRAGSFVITLWARLVDGGSAGGLEFERQAVAGG